MEVSKAPFGKTPEGQEVDVYTLRSPWGVEARIMTLGATLLTVKAPDRRKNIDTITLHLDTLDDYLRGHPLFGSTVGRYANRIANAKFTIDQTEYKLAANAGPHHIHGGTKEAFSRALWKAKSFQDDNSVGVELTHVSNDGEAGFPGTVQARVVYRLAARNDLTIEWSARTDKATHVNLTNHAYWNLAGTGAGDVLGHLLKLNADRYLPSDKAKIPTGEIKLVKDTPFDFTAAKPVGRDIKDVEDQNYDHCYAVNRKAGESMVELATVEDPASGRVMEVATTQPGVQLFTAKFLNNKLKGGGKPFGPYHGLCLETQAFPDAPNKPSFPSTLLRPGEEYRHTTVHRFKVKAG